MARTQATNRLVASNRQVVVSGFNPSLKFDGVNDKVDIPFTTNYANVSYCFWIRNLDWDDYHEVIARTGENQIVIQQTTGKIYFQSTGYLVSDFRFTDKKWHFVVITAEGIAVKIYVDGVLDKSGNITARLTNSANLILGGPTNDFGGNMTKVKIYDSILTQQEITDLYYNNIIPSDPVLNLDFKSGGGDTVFDQSPNGNDGTITGAEWDDDSPFTERKLIGGNLVKNGDFENAGANHQVNSIGWVGEKPLGWYTHYYIGTTTVEFDEDTEQGRVLKISVQTAGGTVICRGNSENYYSKEGFRVKPNTQYIVKAKLKLENMSGDADAAIRMIVRYSDQEGVNKGYNTIIAAKKTNQAWTEHELTITTPKGTAWMHPELRFMGNDGAGTLQGDAYFDDIEITEVGATRNQVS